VPMEEEGKDKEDGELEEETEDSEKLESDLVIPPIYQLIAHYIPKSARCNVLFMLEDHAEGDEKTYYSWAVDRHYDPNLILQFELEYQRQEGRWPAEPYDRMWPGHFEVLEDYWPFKEIKDAPSFTSAMLTEENALIWLLYATPYSAYLVEQFRMFLLYAPKCAPDDPYVPDEKFTEAWDDSRQLLQDCMDAHFQYRPEHIEETMLLDHCVSLIMETGRSMNKKRDPKVVRHLLKVKSDGMWKAHLELNAESEREHNEFLKEEEETPKEKEDQERLERSRAVVNVQQTECLLDFQDTDGTQLYSAIVRKPGSQSPVIRISTQPVVIGTAPDQSRAAPISIPIKEFISNEALQKQCQEQVSKASKRKEGTGKELQRRQKEPIQRIMPEILEPVKEKEPIL
ncbi:MAG: hypothetical protein GY861_03535, partial [bacterium]|nr:hypothetical protein [bacterium]